MKPELKYISVSTGNTADGMNGHYHLDFEPVYQAFKENIETHGESGAHVVIYHQSEKVVDLRGNNGSLNGVWKEGDRVCTMSCCKAPLALCLHLLVERGLLTLDDPLSQHWPEFSQNGKEQVTVRQVLNHTAGLPVLRNIKNGDIFNWSKMIKAIEQAPLVFPAGAAIAYHALTFGHLLGELIRRLDGRMPGDFFHQEVSVPFGVDYDLKHFPDQPIRSIAPHPQFSRLPLWFFCKLPFLIPSWKMQYFRPCSPEYHPNSLQWRSSEIPAVTGQGTAEGLARLYAFLANGGVLGNQRMCRPETVQRLMGVSAVGIEKVSKKQWHMGLGFMLNSPEFVSFGASQNSFGHLGMGGSTGFADPDNNLAFGYVTEKFHSPNKKDKSIAGKRLTGLVEACYRSLS